MTPPWATSERPGLSEFVVGLVRGLADYFSQTVEIEVAELKEDNGTADGSVPSPVEIRKA